MLRRRDRIVYGFDNFEGLPKDWRFGFEKGTFAVKGLLKVRNNVSLVKGWFKESLPKSAKIHNQKISFMHIDCDLYSSTKIVFDSMGDKIKAGRIIVFDEYFNYPDGSLEGLAALSYDLKKARCLPGCIRIPLNAIFKEYSKLPSSIEVLDVSFEGRYYPGMPLIR